MITATDKTQDHGRRPVARGLVTVVYGLLALMPLALVWKAVELAQTWAQWSLAAGLVLLTQGTLWWGIRRASQPRSESRTAAAATQPPARQSTSETAAQPQPDELRSAPVHPPRSGEVCRVLVVEDEKVNRIVAMRLLEQLGYHAEAVDSGQTALDVLEEGDFDLVLMDCQMPGLDGYETTRQIRRRQGDGRHLPIIAVTAHALTGDREKCLAAGMDDYLAKPFRGTELAAILERWLENDAANEQPDSDTSEALDQGTLQTLRRLNEQARNDFLNRAIKDFLCQESPKLAIMRRALGSDNSHNLMQTAHSLCGSAGSLGAFHLSRLCGELVDLAQYNTLSECRIRLRDVEREFERAVTELQQVLNEPADSSAFEVTH